MMKIIRDRMASKPSKDWKAAVKNCEYMLEWLQTEEAKELVLEESILVALRFNDEELTRLKLMTTEERHNYKVFTV